MPHGIYDLQRPHGDVTLGTSQATSACACARLRQWGQPAGLALYAEAEALLLLGAGGGSNRARTYWWKADLAKRVQAIGWESRVAPSPPYTSTSNPMEPRLCPHLTRACQGVIFRSLDLVKNLLATTTTKTS